MYGHSVSRVPFPEPLAFLVTAGQLMQSAHFALQSPYALFGLGMTPNYVDAIIVGMAESTNASRAVSHIFASHLTWKIQLNTVMSSID